MGKQVLRNGSVGQLLVVKLGTYIQIARIHIKKLGVEMYIKPRVGEAEMARFLLAS